MPPPDCKVYGSLHFVRYNKMEFYLGEAETKLAPTQHHLHYLVPPNLLVVHQFSLLQQTKPQSLDQLVQMIVAVAEFAQKAGGEVGMGYNRIGYAGRWGIVGEKNPSWPYNEIYTDSRTEGVFLAPQLMTALSQGKMYPKYNRAKADVFAFGIMLLEIIFQESLAYVFDYEDFEIRLKPLLEKLNVVRQNFGDQLYNIFLKMLELDPEERVDFGGLLELISDSGQSVENNHRISQTTISNSNYSASSSSSIRPRYRNDCSPLKVGRTPERLGKTPQRTRHHGGSNILQPQANNRQAAPQINRSPIKRDLKINPVYDKQNFYPMQNPPSSTRSPLRRREASPLSRRMI